MRAALVALSLLLSGACASRRPGLSRGEREASIRKLLSTQQAAWNRGDIDAFMAGYAHRDDLVFTSGGQVRRGWQETLERYRRRYGADSSTMGQLSFEILDVQMLGRHGAVVLGRWSLRQVPTPATGIFSLVLELGERGWRIIHDHTSLSPGEG